MGRQPWALSLPDKELCLREALAVCTPPALSLLQRGLAPRSKGKARAELRPARRHSRLPHSRSLLLPGENATSWEALGEARPGQSCQSWTSAALAARSVLPSNRSATPLFSPACWELGFQAWAQSTCPELSAQGLVPLRWGCALPSPNAPGRAPNHIYTTLRWGRSPGTAIPAGWQTQFKGGNASEPPARHNRP